MNVQSSLFFCIALLHTSTLSLAQSDADFISIPSGVYEIGQKGNALNPLRKVNVGRFNIATTEVTVTQFFEFVKATGYITDAERLLNAMTYKPGLPENEWKQDSSANWKYPNGKALGLIFDGKMNHPVTCISYWDALLYCKWAGVRMPSLEEWEIASGSYDSVQVSVYANMMTTANKVDTFQYTAPVGRFKPNKIGLFDIYGNIAELCYGKLPGEKTDDVVYVRGGSWRSSRIDINDIGRVSRHASYSNQGFRVVK